VQGAKDYKLQWIKSNILSPFSSKRNKMKRTKKSQEPFGSAGDFVPCLAEVSE
jgi:hypothetical protein